MTGTAIVALGIFGVSPFWIDLIKHMPDFSGHATVIGGCASLLIVGAAASAKLVKNVVAGRVILASLGILAVAMALSRYNIEANKTAARAEAALVAAKTERAASVARQKVIRDEAQARRDAAIAKANARIALGYAKQVPVWRAEGRRDLERAEAIVVPEIIVPALNIRPHQKFRWIAVVGPSAVELSLALLLELMAGTWGHLLAARLREETMTLTQATHAMLKDVDVSKLSDAAREGLDALQGTWRGLALTTPKLRDGVMWPVLAAPKHTVYIGSVPARRLAGEKVPTQNSRKKRKLAAV